MIIYLFRIFIRLYQMFISSFFGAACRFHPTCSNYALESVEQYGMRRGILYSIRRLSKCHPLSKGGYDPVRP